MRFFRQTKADREFVAGTRNVASATLKSVDFAGEDNNPEEAIIFYELRNAEMKSALPVFIDGRSINPSGYVFASKIDAKIRRIDDGFELPRYHHR